MYTSLKQLYETHNGSHVEIKPHVCCQQDTESVVKPHKHGSLYQTKQKLLFLCSVILTTIH